MPMGELASGLDTSVLELLELIEFRRINLDRIDLLTIDVEWRLKLNHPPSRFSSNGHGENELTCHDCLFFLRTGVETDAQKRQSQAHAYSRDTHLLSFLRDFSGKWSKPSGLSGRPSNRMWPGRPEVIVPMRVMGREPIFGGTLARDPAVKRSS